MVDAETVDDFVLAQTTKNDEQDGEDVEELNDDDLNIERFVRNTEKNRFTNISCFDEVLDPNNPEFYVHANTFRSPYGNFMISQAPSRGTIADHLHLLWLFDIRTIVCLVSPEDAGGYFDLKEGGTVMIFMKYTMKTLKVFDEKQGVTVYQCELRSFKESSKHRRVIYIICNDTPVSSIRPPRPQSVLMEYMWSFEEAEQIERPTRERSIVLVHGQSGTRRCASFVISAVMCRQILVKGQFSSMEAWIELRKKRAHVCTRRHDFYSSLNNVFHFAAQCCSVNETDASFIKAIQVIEGLVDKRPNEKEKKAENEVDKSKSETKSTT